MEKGPVDAVTQESRYSLCERGLLRRHAVDFGHVQCLVLQRELEEAFECRVLDCDSVGQVKSKILDAVYKNTPFSLRPAVDEVDLEWQCGQGAHVILQDVDLTTEEDAATKSKKLNTLKHYGIKNKAVVSLIPKQFVQMKVVNEKTFHLVPPGEATSTSTSSSSTSSTTTMALTMQRRAIPEVFLTRMLATKGVLKKFIDDFLVSLTRTHGRFPCAVKWLFDLYDVIGMDDAVVTDGWKANSLPARLWLNLLKNPDAIFDVERTFAVDRNLGVVAQLLTAAMDGDRATCSNATSSSTNNANNSNTNSHKLLFAKEISETESRLSAFYRDVRDLRGYSESDFKLHMDQLSQKHLNMFNECAALQELLYIYNATNNSNC